MRIISCRPFTSCCGMILAAIVLFGVVLPRPARAYLTDFASHPPPASGTYGYNTFVPGSAGFPGVGQTYVDPVFNETVRRLTDETSPARTVDSDIYSKNGFFNADNTLMFHRASPGATRTIIDVRTGAVVCSGMPAAVPSDSSFDPVDPTVWYYFSGNELRRFFVTPSSCQQDPNPVKVFGATLGPLGGSVDWIDNSGRYMMLNIGGMIRVWDKQLDQLYGNPFSFDAFADNGNGWVGISPDGKYLVTAGGTGDAPTHYSFAIDHVNKTLGSPVLFWTLCTGHADLLSASDGKTYYVSFDCHTTGDIFRVDVTIPQDPSNPQKQINDNVMIVDLDTPPLPDGRPNWSDVDGHFSAVSKGPLKDWVYVSIESGDDLFSGGVSQWRRYKQEILMVNVLTGEVRRLAHHRSRSLRSGYYRQPRVSASWDGGEVAWASNFNLSNGFDYADIYAITVPTGGAGGDVAPPTVSITAPVNGATVSGTQTVTATANDNIGVVGVQFKLDGQALGTEDLTVPYSVNWNTAQTTPGAHTLTAVARDAAGNQTTSSPVSVTISSSQSDTTPPSVSMTAPANGATVSGTQTVTATATDNVGVVGVQFKLDGQNLGTEDLTAPYSVSWNTSQTAPGTHTLTAVARDAAGNQTTSSPVSVTVQSPPVDTTPPSVSITAPANGATVSGTQTVTATATDNMGVVGVQFKLDGANLGTEDTTAPYQVTWDTTTATAGSHTLTAVARDAAGNQATSTAVTVTVSRLVVENVVWTSVTNATVNGNSLSKTGGCQGCADAGAVSQQQIASGDGYVEFTVSNVTADRLVGLSNGNPGTSGSEIDFAFYIDTGVAAVYESGTYQNRETTIVAGDVLRIAVVGGVVKYFKNGAQVHSSVAPTYPLLVDTALFELGADVQNAVIARASGGGGGGPANVVWTSVANATVSGNSLSKTSGCQGCGDSGAVSQQQIASGDGYVEFTVSNVNADRFVGLSNGNPGTSGSEIDFAFYIDTGFASVYEGGVYRNSDTTVVAGDVLRIAVVGGVVKYFKNGALLHTSVAPTYPLLVDTALFELGADVQNAVIAGAQ